MYYRLLGRTGLKVSSVCLGTVYFGSQIPTDESVRIIHRALDAGINFIDTAEIYMRPAYGAAEETVGKALLGHRDRVVLATKKRVDPPAFQTGGVADHRLTRQQILTAIDGSLRRLRTDYVDIYYAHRPDPTVPLDETLRALDDVVRAGKARYVALSNYAAWSVVSALWKADALNLAPVACVQALYNLLDRSIERELIPACREFGVGIVTYSPLAGGVLTGKYRSSTHLPPDSRAARVGRNERGRPGHIPVLSDRNLVIAQRLADEATPRGMSAAQLALAWAVHQPAVASVILGASTVEQLQTNLKALDITLGPADLSVVANLAES